MRFVRGGVAAQNRDHVVNQAATSIVASSQPNVLFATYGEDLYESRDAGCNWSKTAHLGAVRSYGWYIALARPEGVLVHDTEQLIEVTASGVRSAALPERMLRLFANPANARHLRAIALYGVAYESTDGGETWSALGDSTTSLLYAAAIDPSNFDRLLVTSLRNGVIASHDGGRNWSPTGALSQANVFYLEFSPADAGVVWAVGLVPNVSGDKLYRSVDGGMSFTAVLDSTSGLQFSRAELAPHPRNANILALDSSNGVAVYDHATGQASLVSPKSPSAFTWSPAEVLYFSAPDEWIIIN